MSDKIAYRMRYKIRYMCSFCLSGYSPFAQLTADCPPLNQSKFLSALCSLSVASYMKSVRAMPPKSKFACTTWSSNCLRPLSSGCEKVAPVPCWKCSTCIQQLSRLHKRSTSLTMTKITLVASTGTGGKCPSPSLNRSPLKRALLTSSQRKSLNGYSR